MSFMEYSVKGMFLEQLGLVALTGLQGLPSVSSNKAGWKAYFGMANDSMLGLNQDEEPHDPCHGRHH
jgi:hypothetical protein